MKKNMLLLLIMLMFVACETGTKYDKNTSTTTQKEPNVGESGLVDHEINVILNEDDSEDKSEGKKSFVDVSSENSTTISDTFDEEELTGGNGLDVKQIREGKHKDYVRLVFDVYDRRGVARSVGKYTSEYNKNKDDIVVLLNGYRKFSARIPSFSIGSPIEQIYFEKHEENSAYKFHIKLRGDSKVRMFALENPARLVFDIKPI